MEAFAIALVVLGFLLLFVTAIWLLIEAFRENIWWGLASLFLPFAALVFVVVHWGRARMPFLIHVVAWMIMFGGAFASPNFRQQISQGLPEEFARAGGLEKSRDIGAEIQTHRDDLERLEGQLAHDGATLAQEYQALTNRRAALKQNDDASVAAFNTEAATYQQKNSALKALKQQIDATREQLNKLLDEKARQSVTAEARKSSATGGHGASGRPAAASSRVVMYTTARCPACTMAKTYFARKGVSYEEKNVEASPAAREEFARLGGRGVPLILIGNERMEGFNEHRLNQLL